MKDRVMQIVQLKTNGRMGKFGELCGWSAQYTHRVLKEGSIGLQPCIAILNAFPDINARWLLTGQGNMLDKTYSYGELSRKALELVKYEKFLCVMTDEEINKFVNTNDAVDKNDVYRWQMLLDERNRNIDTAFEKAYKRLNDEHTEVSNRG